MQQRVAVTVAEAGRLQFVDVAGHGLVYNETDADAVGARHGGGDALIGPLDFRATVRGVEMMGRR